jgi:hypothetical protein
MNTKPKGKPRGRPFAKGFDSQRHVLSKNECRKGYEIAARLAKMPSRTRSWLRSKIRNYYLGRGR